MFLMAAVVLFIIIDKTWALWVGTMGWAAGFIVSFSNDQWVFYLIASAVLVPVAVGLRLLVRHLRHRGQ